MSNVIAWTPPTRRLRLIDRVEGLVACFATHRRMPDDVFWLKENAELLNILECTGQKIRNHVLEPLASFYDSLEDRLRFFPQYYRFLLSIGLDLEDLGMPGDAMEAACASVARSGLSNSELSDLQRAEARRLLARRGVANAETDLGLNDRLRAFVSRSATFALPNKKAAYELTHIVFYLSEYGRRDPQLGNDVLLSLEFAGIVAFLDQNFDLLAEVCIAMRQAGKAPHPIWEDAIRESLNQFRVTVDNQTPLSDSYHEYLVSTWSVLAMGYDDSGVVVPQDRCLFHAPFERESALRAMSFALLSQQTRSTDWARMRHRVTSMISLESQSILARAEASSRHFERFFEAFSRA